MSGPTFSRFEAPSFRIQHVNSSSAQGGPSGTTALFMLPSWISGSYISGHSCRGLMHAKARALPCTLQHLDCFFLTPLLRRSLRPGCGEVETNDHPQLNLHSSHCPLLGHFPRLSFALIHTESLSLPELFFFGDAFFFLLIHEAVIRGELFVGRCTSSLSKALNSQVLCPPGCV